MPLAFEPGEWSPLDQDPLEAEDYVKLQTIINNLLEFGER